MGTFAPGLSLSITSHTRRYIATEKTRAVLMKNMMRWISLAMCLLFSAFAVLQWNDPDPFRWVVIYGLTALLWLWRWWVIPPRWITIPIFLGILIWWASLIPSVIHWINLGAPSLMGSMKAESPHIELVREWGGLLITLVAILPLLSLKGRVHRKAFDQNHAKNHRK